MPSHPPISLTSSSSFKSKNNSTSSNIQPLSISRHSSHRLSLNNNKKQQQQTVNNNNNNAKEGSKNEKFFFPKKISRALYIMTQNQILNLCVKN